MNCIICNGNSHSLFQKNGYWICECEVCHHRFANISPSNNHPHNVYGDQYFYGGDCGYPNYFDEEKILTSHGRHYASLLSAYMDPGNMLDVGCAAGFILKGFQDCGWIGMGIEPNLKMAEYARSILGTKVINTPFEEFQSNMQFDLISMIQVIPHFFNLRKALQVAAGLTKPGGYWLVETWNRESFIARILGKHWHEYCPPSVLHWFSPKGINRLAAQFGFQEVYRGRPAKKISGKHVKFVLGQNADNSSVHGIFNHIVSAIPNQITIPYPLNDIFWSLLKKNYAV